jgi:hypothetical protein
MPLKLRPTGLGSGIDKDRPDYAVCTGEWEVGRIYQTRGGPDSLRWFWSLWSDDALGSGGDPRGSQGAIFRRAGTLGRRGRSWKRRRTNHDKFLA